LAAREPFAITALQTFQDNKISTLIPPRVISELQHHLEAKDPAKLQRARAVVACIQAWKFEPVLLDDAKKRNVKTVAEALLDGGLIPPREVNDAYILAQCTQMEIDFLVTSDHHLLEIDREDLHRFYKEKNRLYKVEIVSPRLLARRLG
jgi:predicted nucleic acid-binding protein